MTFHEWYAAQGFPAISAVNPNPADVAIMATAQRAWGAAREECAKIAESQAFAHRHAGDGGPDLLCIQAARIIREGK